jgi:hypothetical protein
MSIVSFVSKTLKFVAPALIAGAISMAAPSTADAQVVVGVGVNYYPPAAYIATAQPEYFENRPVYYYNNSWYYRDHGRWSYYRSEPDYLRGRRANWGEHRYGGGRVVREPVRYHYRR